MNSSDRLDNQIGVCTYLIDRLALRVGNEKGEDEADTVVHTSQENITYSERFGRDGSNTHRTTLSTSFICNLAGAAKTASGAA